MFNLIKMDLHRMVRTVSFRVMLLVTIAIAVFMVGVTSLDVSMAKDNLEQAKMQEEVLADAVKEGETVTDATQDGEVVVQVGITLAPNLTWVEEVPMSDLINEMLNSGMLLLVCAIFVPLFVNAENGYIKNIAGQFPNREVLVGSKLVAVAVQLLILFFTYILSVVICGMIFFSDTWVVGNIGELLGCLGLHYLLCLAFGYLGVMLTLVSKSAALPLTLGVLCSTGFMVLIYGGINLLVGMIVENSNFDISMYSLEMNTAIISPALSVEDLVRMIIVGVVYAVAAVLISVVVVKKRDV